MRSPSLVRNSKSPGMAVFMYMYVVVERYVAMVTKCTEID